jgi:hypothetical protein
LGDFWADKNLSENSTADLGTGKNLFENFSSDLGIDKSGHQIDALEAATVLLAVVYAVAGVDSTKPFRPKFTDKSKFGLISVRNYCLKLQYYGP